MMGSNYKDTNSVAFSRKEGSLISGKGSQFHRGKTDGCASLSVSDHVFLHLKVEAPAVLTDLSAPLDATWTTSHYPQSWPRHNISWPCHNLWRATAGKTLMTWWRKKSNIYFTKLLVYNKVLSIIQVLNQHLSQFQTSDSSSWETGYVSGQDNFGNPPTVGIHRPRYPQDQSSTYHQRDDLETEIF